MDCSEGCPTAAVMLSAPAVRVPAAEREDGGGLCLTVETGRQVEGCHTVAACSQDHTAAGASAPRQHLDGNAWSEPEPSTGIELHRYGSHIFRTSSERVWVYVNRFGAFTDYRYHVWTVRGRVDPMPIGLATMTQIFDRVLTPEPCGRWWPGARAAAAPDPGRRRERARARAVALGGAGVGPLRPRRLITAVSSARSQLGTDSRSPT